MADFTTTKWQDRQLNDKALFDQFLIYWQNGNYQQALDIVNNNAQLENKAFVADVLNVIGSALAYLQNNYFTNVEDVFKADLVLFNQAIGRFINTNTYSPTKQYYVNNFVVYNDQVYMCIQNSLGNLPTDIAYWMMIGLKGENGALGTGLNLKYTWGATTPYNAKDVVYLSGVLYVALQANTNKNPINQPTYWQVFMKVPKTSMTVSRTQPVDPYEGQIWIRLILGP